MAIVTRRGTVVTPEYEADLAAEAEAGYELTDVAPRRTVGRPSLSGRSGSSHRMDVRIDDETYQAVREAAQRENKPISELVRHALRAAFIPQT